MSSNNTNQDVTSEKTCSICLNFGVNFVDESEISKLKNYFDYFSLLTPSSNFQICDLCVEDINYQYGFYLNAINNSIHTGNEFVYLGDLPMKDSNNQHSPIVVKNLPINGSDVPVPKKIVKTINCDICNENVEDIHQHIAEEHPIMMDEASYVSVPRKRGRPSKSK